MQALFGRDGRFLQTGGGTQAGGHKGVVAGRLNTLWLHLCDGVHYNELAFDIASALMRLLATPLPQPQLQS